MSAIAIWLKKSFVVAAVAAISLSAMPIAGAYAQSPNPPVMPVPGQTVTDRLQRAWAREQAVYTRIGNLLQRADTLVSRIQNKIDQAKANSKDVSALQAALDAFSAALKDVHPIYESMNGIVTSHQGFDSSGNVTDPTKALETVKDVRAKLMEIRQTGIRDATKALHDAIQAYRQANPSATPIPSS